EGVAKVNPYQLISVKLWVNIPNETFYDSIPTATDTFRSYRASVCHRSATVLEGTLSLHDYLKQVGERAAFIVSDILDEQNWAPFERDYASSGRAPYSPRSMMGILLYGLMKGISSLRGLERLARLDLGCLFVSHGITPDHASLRRFIYQHQSTLTDSFFEGVASSVLHHSQSDVSCLAGDGTVIEAACSHYNLLTQEAILREKKR
ncbi:transposase, partial [Photorhabdus hainanensis]|uniref:transposase n=1 Tax=Photorhabdus hainanensis TaxID=1004166 RepID=UPI001FEA20BC